MIGDNFINNFNGGDFQAPKSQFIQMNGRCPVCKHQFDFKRLNILFENQGGTLLYITCQNCHSSTLASVMVGQNGVNFSGIVTDLSITDVFKFKDADPISSEYIMDLHSELESNPSLTS